MQEVKWHRRMYDTEGELVQKDIRYSRATGTEGYTIREDER